MDKPGCKCPCHKMLGVWVALFGLSRLLGTLGVLDRHVVEIVWPVIVMLLGLQLFCGGVCKCCGQGECK